MVTPIGQLPRYPFARVMGVLLLLLAASVACALSVGQGELSDVSIRDTLLQLRAGRIAAAFLCGSALAVGGVLVQGLFRNPLASPSVIGTTAGAAFGGRVALLLVPALAGSAWLSDIVPEMLLPVGCVLGALLALAILLVVTRVREDLVVVLLTGFLLSSLFLSMSSFLTSLAQERWELARAMISFALGDLTGAGVRHIALALPLVVAGLVSAWIWSSSLDVMLTGEEEAKSLGVDVNKLRMWTTTWTAILTAAAVSVGGNVGFVGLVVPHALRPFVGVTHRKLVCASTVAGGTFLILCDVACRAIPGRGELPLGVVTGLIGAPAFLWLLSRDRGGNGG